jgi:hypothetical protein
MDATPMLYVDDVTMFWIKVLIAILGLAAVGWVGDRLLTKKGGAQW